MPYKPPEYQDLCTATSELHDLFNRNCGRYFPPTCELLCEQGSGMERSYRRHIKEKHNLLVALSPDEDRLDEINCITRLIVGLRDASDKNLTQNIILGAMFYRRITFKAGYSESFVGKVLALVPESVSTMFSREMASAMYRTIGEVLGISPTTIVDDLTVLTCCRAYHKYLSDLVDARQDVVPYIPKKEPHILAALSDIILKVEGGADAIAERIRRLTAIQSIAAILSKTDTDVCVGLDLLSKALSTQLSKKDKLSREEIIACMPKSLSLQTQEIIIYLVADNMVVNKENIALFVATMKSCLIVYSQYVLLGAYVVVINECREDAGLVLTLKQSIGAHKLGNSMDDDAIDTALRALKAYLELPEMSTTFNFAPWHGHKTLIDKVKTQARELASMRDMVMSATMSMTA